MSSVLVLAYEKLGKAQIMDLHGRKASVVYQCFPLTCTPFILAVYCAAKVI